jgi:DNA polymerase V
MDLPPASTEGLSLCLGSDEPETRTRLMTALEGINQRSGRGTLRLASAGTPGKTRAWEMKSEWKTPDYTTNWDALLITAN